MKAVAIFGTAVAALFAMSATAATNPDMTKNAPASVSESAPDKTMDKDKGKGKAGEATMPKKAAPASVSESAPDKSGKEKAAPKMKDSKDMPNPKTPASPSESKPSAK